MSSQSVAPNPDVGAKPFWAVAEILMAVAIIIAGLRAEVLAFMFGSAPWLAALGALSLWWRGPKLWSRGSSRTSSLRRAVAIGICVGVIYQLIGTFAVEPILARLTSGHLPDVSGFRSIVGNEAQLAFWIALSWSLAAFIEEISYRGWVLTRFAEIGCYSKAAWAGGLVASSALFGVVHAYQGLSGVFATGLTGLVFAGVYLVTGRNIWAAIVAHGVLDTTGFVMMYFGVYPGI